MRHLAGGVFLAVLLLAVPGHLACEETCLADPSAMRPLGARKPVPRPPLMEHPRRRAILAFLRTRPSASAAELRGHLGTSSSVADWHLRQMVRAHVIRKVRAGAELRYAVELSWPPGAPAHKETDTHGHLWKMEGQEGREGQPRRARA